MDNKPKKDESQRKAELVTLINQRLISAKNGRNSAWSQRDNVDNYMNLTYHSKGVKNQAKVIVNLIMTTIENLAALMQDNPIDIMLSPKLPKYELAAKIRQAAIKSLLDRTKNKIKRKHIHKWMMFSGTAIYKLSVEAKDEKDLGKGYNILIDVPNTHDVFVDTMATNCEDILYVIELCRYTQKEVKEYWPEYKMISGDTGDSASTDDITAFNAAENYDENKIIEVREYWEAPEKGKKACNRIVATDQQILEEEESEMLIGFPYIFIPCILIPGQLFGKDLIKDLKPIEQEFNKILKRISKIIAKTANAVVLISADSNINPDRLTNEEGMKVTGINGPLENAIKYLYPPPVEQVFFQLLGLLQQLYTIVSGIQDVMQGNINLSTAGGPSGRSIEMATQAAQTRLREMVSNLKLFGYEELAKKLNILFQQFGTVEETIKISGNTEEEIMQALNSEHNDAVQQILAAGGRTPEEIRAGVEMKFEDLGITSLQKRSGKTYMSFVGKELGDPNEFEVEVRAGTDIPKTKLDIVAMTEKMMGNPATALDIETFLDIIEFPQKDKVLERNKLWQMFRQWLVQQQEAEKQGQQSQQVPEGSQGPGQAQPQGQPGQGPAGGPGMGQVA